MEIIDLQTEEKFLFIISCWLAVDKADGIMDCIIPVSGEEELQLPIYQQNSSRFTFGFQSMLDPNGLSSLGARDYRSRFHCCFVPCWQV